MQTIIIETEIAASPERCFLLSLSIDLHMQSTANLAGAKQALQEFAASKPSAARG